MELRWAARGARAAAMARERIAKTGIAPGGHPIWTDREMALLAVIYPDYQRAIAVLGRRSYWALRHRAQIMGLTSNHHHRWTGAEISRLRKLYPTADNIAFLNAFPGLSLSQIQRRATHPHIYRKRRPFKKTGIKIIDQIRNRAFELNVSMIDLDAMAKTKAYFHRSGWRKGYINHQAIAKAAHALDGLMAVQWREAS